MEKFRSRKTFLLTLTISILLFSKCQNPTEQTQTQKPYFDLTGFFNDQMAQLQKDSMIVLKTSAINQKTDEHEIDWVDWKREFALFLASDINKSSLLGKYAVDTIHVQSGDDSGKVKIRYVAQDSSIRTRLLEVTSDNLEVKEIHIVNKTSAFLSTSSENLMYLPMKAYVIKSSIENRFFGGNDFSMMGLIAAKEKKYF